MSRRDERERLIREEAHREGFLLGQHTVKRPLLDWDWMEITMMLTMVSAVAGLLTLCAIVIGSIVNGVFW